MGVALVVLGYFVVMGAIGTYMVKKQSSVSEYFVAKRNLGALLIIPLVFGEIIAGSSTVGNAAQAFGFGISSVWVNWGMAFGCILVLLFIGKFYRVVGNKMGAMTVPEAYRFRFDAKTRMLMMLTLVLVYLILFAMQPLAAGAIIAPLLGTDKVLTIWVVGLIFVYLAVTGGMRGMAWMNSIHACVMYVGLVVVCYAAVKYAGGMSALQAALPAEYFRFDQPDLQTVLGWFIGTALSFFAASVLAAAVYGANDWSDVKKGFWGAGLLAMVFAVFPALIGVAGKVVLPDADANSILYLMAAKVGPTYAVLASMGVLAAIMSTGPAMLLLVMTMLSRDVYRVLRPGSTEAEEMRFARIIGITLGLIAVFLGMRATSILGQLAGAFQIRAIAGLVLVVAAFWPRVDSRAAFWSMLTGGVIAAVWHFAGNPFGITSLWPSLIVGVPVLVILTLMAKQPVDEGYARYEKALAEATVEGIV